MGWKQLATVADIRGASGSDVGTIGAPLFSARQDIVVNQADSNVIFNTQLAQQYLILSTRH